MFQSIGIIGCGLIGGSLALTINKIYPNIRIYGVDEKASNLKNHPQTPCFTQLTESLNDIPKNIDIIFIATPINKTLETIKKLSNHVAKSTILTDVTSVKESLITIINDLAIDNPYISGHPMAGKETTGFESATETLFNNAPYILIETAFTDQENQLSEFLTSLSCRVISQTAKQHDELIALVSHLPYLTASSLIGVATKEYSLDTIKAVYGPGFKDCTRLAASSPDWGSDICDQNKVAITNSLDKMIQSLKQLKSVIQTSEIETLKHILASNKQKKDEL